MIVNMSWVIQHNQGFPITKIKSPTAERRRALDVGPGKQGPMIKDLRSEVLAHVREAKSDSVNPI
jgi:hypothetical protein